MVLQIKVFMSGHLALPNGPIFRQRRNQFRRIVVLENRWNPRRKPGNHFRFRPGRHRTPRLPGQPALAVKAALAGNAGAVACFIRRRNVAVYAALFMYSQNSCLLLYYA